MIMLQVAQDREVRILDKLESGNVLDICCGTGLSLEKFVDHPNIALLSGLDISPTT